MPISPQNLQSKMTSKFSPSQFIQIPQQKEAMAVHIVNSVIPLVINSQTITEDPKADVFPIALKILHFSLLTIEAIGVRGMGELQSAISLIEFDWATFPARGP
jgi:hypothetical protein